MGKYFDNQAFIAATQEQRDLMLAALAEQAMLHRDIINMRRDREEIQSAILVALIAESRKWGVTKTFPASPFNYLTTIAVRTAVEFYNRSKRYGQKVHIGLAEDKRGRYTAYTH